MAGEEHEETTIYKVVVNREERYSIWPAVPIHSAGRMSARVG